MAKIDLELNKPKDKRELTKENMLKFMESANRTNEEVEWFLKLMEDNKIKKTMKLRGEVEEVDGYRLDKVREAFAQKYFPEISSKNKKEAKKKTTDKKQSFEDRLKALKRN